MVETMNYGQAIVAWWCAPRSDRVRWERERHDVIGGSDLGTLMAPRAKGGLRRLREEKLGQATAWPGNYATRRGHAIESFLCSEASKRLNTRVVHPCQYPLEHPSESRLRVNLDGFATYLNAPVECKDASSKDVTIAAAMSDGIAPGPVLLNTAPGMPKKLPAKWLGHWWQIQGQMCVLGSDVGYFAIDAAKTFYLCRVAADHGAWERMFEAVRTFWTELNEPLPPETPWGLDEVAAMFAV